MKRLFVFAGFMLFALAHPAHAGSPPTIERSAAFDSDISSRSHCACAWRPARAVRVRHVHSRYVIRTRPVLRLGYDPLPYRFGYYSPPYRYLYRQARW